ncbi:MAG: hypothetical protein IT242_06530 [Bacteroidia bacterium]|nr:hypothetical protein [Bacteroidia bacterium]
MKTKLLILISVILVLIIVSCEKDSGPYIITKPVDTTHIVSFSNEIQPIFNDRCIVCHNQNHPFLDLRPGYSYDQLLYTGANAPYVDINNPEQSILYEHIMGVNASIMPPNNPPLTDDQKNLILLWIIQKAQNN